jgi:dienelactone hydrolase
MAAWGPASAGLEEIRLKADATRDFFAGPSGPPERSITDDEDRARVDELWTALQYAHWVRNALSAMKPIGVVLMAAITVLGAQTPPVATPPSVDETRQIERRMNDLAARVKTLAAKHVDPGLLADVDIYRKAAEYILRFPEEFANKAFVANTLAVLEIGLTRARELDAGAPSWPTRKGHVVRAYVSRVDGSVQPYGLTIPESYDGTRPVRLDVWQHGTNRTLNEVAFIVQQEQNKSIPPEQDYIQLEPLGRTNLSYRWAGEADMFESLASVQKRYKIDPHRIVLRGFSMGGASSWHLGLHHPGTWAAIEAGAGYTETRVYGRRDNLPPYQEAMLHYYDAVDYSLNAFNTPTVGYGGEKDAQLQASVNIREQLTKEGFRFQPDGPYRWVTSDLRALFLVGPETAHSWHADSKAQSNAFINKALATAGQPPTRLRFVTYTTRFNRSYWLTVDGLEQTYARGEVDATRSNDGTDYRVTTKNISGLTIDGSGGTFTIDSQRLTAGAHPSFEKIDGRWHVANRVRSDSVLQASSRSRRSAVPEAAPGVREGGQGSAAQAGVGNRLRKVHGLQGPVDDAFMDAFLCVRPTGTAWNGATQAWAGKTLDVFRADFAKWLRGDVRVTDDRAVTARDIADYHLILFGDPGSNSVIARLFERLPIRWSKTEIAVGARTFGATDHIPVLIYPNPLNPKRYVVINSGHTFGEPDFRGTNAWLYPRLGDYAVLTATGDVALSGFFDEQWRLK